VVTYSWTTTSQGFGPHLDQPSTATFDVPLSSVLAGVINYIDITNIHLSYPGLTFDFFSPSSIGFESQAFVDPTTGAFVYHDPNQGLAVFAADTSDPNFSTFLSITIDNPVGGSVRDQYNALNHGAAYAGYPTAGYWTASFPATTGPGAAPEASTWMMMIVGFGVLGGAMRRHGRRVTRISFAG